MLRKLLTARDVSEILQLSYENALDFIKHSGVDYIKIGNQYRVLEDNLIEFLRKKGKKGIDLHRLN